MNKIKFCPSCGEKFKDNFCWKCGYPNKEIEGHGYCPQCGSIMTSKTCDKCGCYYYDDSTDDLMELIESKSCYNECKSLPENRTGMIFSAIGSVLYAVSVFLPYISISAFGFKQTTSLYDNVPNDCYVIFVLALISLIIALKGSITGMIFSGAVSAIFGIMRNKATMDAYIGTEYENFVTPDIGYYMLIISAALIIIGGIVQKIQEN